MSKPTRQEIIQKFRERQDKFVYYVMGLDVAAIGFTLSKTFDKKNFDLDDTFLGLALVAWLLSILYAFRWVQTEFKGMQLDMTQYDINDVVLDEMVSSQLTQKLGEDNEIATEDEVKEFIEDYRQMLNEKVQADMAKELKHSQRDYRRKLFLFIFGIIFFMIWRIIEITNILK